MLTASVRPSVVRARVVLASSSFMMGVSDRDRDRHRRSFLSTPSQPPKRNHHAARRAGGSMSGNVTMVFFKFLKVLESHQFYNHETVMLLTFTNVYSDTQVSTKKVLID